MFQGESAINGGFPYVNSLEDIHSKSKKKQRNPHPSPKGLYIGDEEHWNPLDWLDFWGATHVDSHDHGQTTHMCCGHPKKMIAIKMGPDRPNIPKPSSC